MDRQGCHQGALFTTLHFLRKLGRAREFDLGRYNQLNEPIHTLQRKINDIHALISSTNIGIMEILCLINSLVVVKNKFLILLSKNWLFLNLVKPTSINWKDSQSVLFFFSRFSDCCVMNNFVIFYWIKVVKYIRDLFCHLETENGT